jgi:hypothetical protein
VETKIKATLVPLVVPSTVTIIVDKQRINLPIECLCKEDLHLLVNNFVSSIYNSKPVKDDKKPEDNELLKILISGIQQGATNYALKSILKTYNRGVT